MSLYAIKNSDPPSIRMINSQSDLYIDEILYDGELIFENGELVMRFSESHGLEPAPQIDKLNIAKKQRMQLLNTLLDKALSAGVEIDDLGIRMDCDTKSILNLHMSYLFYKRLFDANPNITVKICDYNNQILSITFQEFVQLLITVWNRYRNLYEKKWEKRIEILTANTIDEVLAVRWN